MPALITGEIGLLPVGVEGELEHAQHLGGDVVLPGLAVEGGLYHAQGLVGEIHLPALAVEGSIRRPTRTLVGAVRLKGLRPRLTVRVGTQVFVMTGDVRQFGSAIICFLGPPYRVIEWSIVEGAGMLVPYTPDVTDQWGRGFCLYHAGNYQGKVRVQVEYGS